MANKRNGNKKDIELVVLKKHGIMLKGKNLELRTVKWVPDDKDEDEVESKHDLRSWYEDDKEVEHANKATATFTREELQELVTNLAEFLAKTEDEKPKRGRKAKASSAKQTKKGKSRK